MNRSLSAFASTAVIAFACFGSAPAKAIPLCDWLIRSYCSAGCYTYKVPNSQVIEGTEDCDARFAFVEESVGVAPAEPVLQCSRSANGYACQAWPQGSEISYDWHGDNSAIVTDVLDPIHEFSCSAGTVSVSVVAPGGATSTASVNLPNCN